MLERLKYVLSSSAGQPVFVIGTGRSGTHWLGQSLGSHPEVRATVEAMPMFGLSTRMAMNPDLERRLFAPLVAAYRWQLFRSAPRIYVDKTHPNIWIAERLKAAFPRSLFVGIERNPYATVASMMNHKGVSAWHKRWREFPLPNRFLGITRKMAATYDDLPVASKCAIRWVAHHDRMRDLLTILGSDILLIRYEEFARDTSGTVRRLEKFLGLRKPIPKPDVRVESLDKWRIQLSGEQIEQIRAVVGLPPE